MRASGFVAVHLHVCIIRLKQRWSDHGLRGVRRSQLLDGSLRNHLCNKPLLQASTSTVNVMVRIVVSQLSLNIARDSQWCRDLSRTCWTASCHMHGPCQGQVERHLLARVVGFLPRETFSPRIAAASNTYRRHRGSCCTLAPQQ